MRIYIPSRGRADQIKSGPLADFDNALVARTVYVVPPAEVDAYSSALLKAGCGDCKIKGVPYDSIGEKRALIGRMAANAGEEVFLMVDDDVGLLVRKSDEDWPLRRAEAKDIWAMLEVIGGLLEGGGCSSVGVSSREGNNRAGIGSPLAPNLVPRNTRLMRVVAYRTEDFLACEHDRLRCMEDFDVQLQLLRRGKENACIYYWANGQSRTNAPGGCSLWRTREVHNAAAEGLARLHPGFVRLRQKTNKTDSGGLGTRTEVTISWKRAACEKT